MRTRARLAGITLRYVPQCCVSYYVYSSYLTRGKREQRSQRAPSQSRHVVGSSRNVLGWVRACFRLKRVETYALVSATPISTHGTRGTTPRRAMARRVLPRGCAILNLNTSGEGGRRISTHLSLAAWDAREEVHRDGRWENIFIQLKSPPCCWLALALEGMMIVGGIEKERRGGDLVGR